MQPDPTAPAPVLLQRELTIDQSQHDRLVDHTPGTVDDGQVAGEETDAGHAVTSTRTTKVAGAFSISSSLKSSGRSR